MPPGSKDGDGDDGDVVGRLFGDELESGDLPRSPFAPSRAALDDLDRRISSRLIGAWATWLEQIDAIAVAARRNDPGRSWPTVSAGTRVELLAELERLRPGLTRTKVMEALGDDGALRSLVEAIVVVDACGSSRDDT